MPRQPPVLSLGRPVGAVERVSAIKERARTSKCRPDRLGAREPTLAVGVFETETDLSVTWK